jgi:hypothetical protein
LHTLAAMRAVLALILAAAGLAAGGCGEERGDAQRTTPKPVGAAPALDPRAVATTSVSLVDYGLDVTRPRVSRAGRIAVAVINDGVVRHALALDGPAGLIRTRALVPGERTTLSVSLPQGTYRWYCPIADHEQRGMVGRLRVAE